MPTLLPPFAAQEIIMQALKPKPVHPTVCPGVPWNKGAFVGPKPPLKPKQVWSIRLTLQREGRIRLGAVRPCHRQQAARL